MLNPNSPATLLIIVDYEVKSGIPAVEDVRLPFECHVKGVCLAPRFGIDVARRLTALDNKRRTSRRIYRATLEDKRSALVSQPDPAEITVDSVAPATTDGESYNEVALVDKLDHVGHSYECARVYRLARLDGGIIGNTSATVLKRSPSVMSIVVNGNVKGICKPFQRAFDMPADRIVDHLEAIADDVRPTMKPRPRRDNRGKKKGSKPTLTFARHCYAVNNKPLHSQLPII